MPYWPFLHMSEQNDPHILMPLPGMPIHMPAEGLGLPAHQLDTAMLAD